MNPHLAALIIGASVIGIMIGLKAALDAIDRRIEGFTAGVLGTAFVLLFCYGLGWSILFLLGK